MNSGVPQGLKAGLILCNFFINYLDNGKYCAVSKLLADIKLGGATDRLMYQMGVLPLRDILTGQRNRSAETS